MGAQEPPAHIPAFLPAFPDKHTYVATPAFAGNAKDAKRQRADAGKARKQVRRAVLAWPEGAQATGGRGD